MMALSGANTGEFLAGQEHSPPLLDTLELVTVLVVSFTDKRVEAAG